MDCYRHPGVIATSYCVGCRQRICSSCREDVAGHPMCHACVAAAQGRLTGTGGVSSEAAAAAPAHVGVAREDAERCGLAQYAKAALFAAAAAVIGAVVWDKIVLVTHLQLGIIAVALGALVGVAICKGAEDRPGALLPWLGALMAGFSILLGYALPLQDVVGQQDAESARSLASIPFLARIPFLMVVAIRSGFVDLLDWVFVAIGVWEGWRIPQRLLQEDA